MVDGLRVMERYRHEDNDNNNDNDDSDGCSDDDY